ncbi:MAG TPA: hypothetical protein DEP74_07215 [Citrobacter freundii]|nr:hypothetical protein [Citrobacter freundii]
MSDFALSRHGLSKLFFQRHRPYTPAVNIGQIAIPIVPVEVSRSVPRKQYVEKLPRKRKFPAFVTYNIVRNDSDKPRVLQLFQRSFER